MDRRRQNRFAAELSVRLWGLDASHQAFAEVARVQNISDNGMVVKGLIHRLRVGSIVEVQLGRESSQFRVVWLGHGKKDGQIGLVRFATEPVLWKSHSKCFAQAAGSS